MSNYYCYQSFHSFKSPQILNFIFIEPQTDKDSLQYSLTLPLLSFVLQSESNSIIDNRMSLLKHWILINFPHMYKSTNELKQRSRQLLQNKTNPIQYHLFLLLLIPIIINGSIIPHQKSQTQIRLLFNIGTLSRKRESDLTSTSLFNRKKCRNRPLTVHTKIHQLMSCMLKLKSTGS